MYNRFRLSLIAFIIFPLSAQAFDNSNRTQDAMMRGNICSPSSLITRIVSVQQVGQLTGQPSMNNTGAVNVYGTDLGSMFSHSDGRIYFLFGDTFGYPGPPGSQDWRSNTMAYTTDMVASDGIVFDGWITDVYGRARAVVPGNHNPNDGSGEVTKIPTAGWSVQDRQFLWYMSVNYWGPSGVWYTNHAEIAYSDDNGHTWIYSGARWPGNSNFIQVTVAEYSGYLYFWGIPAGRFGGVKLARVLPSDVLDLSAYRYYTGTGWSANEQDGTLIVDAPVGELSVIWNPYLERWIMMYLYDETPNEIQLREAEEPHGPWSEPIQVVSGNQYPALYGAYMHETYTENNGETVYFLMSQWGPYNVFLMKAQLERNITEITLDFGDIPGNTAYPFNVAFRTLLDHDGARHQIDPMIYMGASIDAEDDGQPTSTIDGDDTSGQDDEDGVTFPSSVLQGESVPLDIQVSADGYISAWTVWGDDDLINPPDLPATIEPVFNDVPVYAGMNTLTLEVPKMAIPGSHAIRFRYSTQTGVESFGLAPDGEVEDHVLTIEKAFEYDYGDLPDSPDTDPDEHYPTLENNQGAAHRVAESVFLGQRIEADGDGQPDTEAMGDDSDGYDDEDGVIFHPMPHSADQIGFTVTASAQGYLNAWIDWNDNKDFADSDEQICTNKRMYAGKNRMVISVPSSVTRDSLYARFRFDTQGDLSWNFKADDGEVEDYYLCLHDIAPKTWHIPMRVYAEGYDKEHIFGVHPDGSDGFDTGLDEEGPASPQTGGSYFECPADPQRMHLKTDIRSPQFDPESHDILWTMIMDAQETATVSWEPTTLPPRGLFLIQPADGSAAINMRHKKSLTVNGCQTLQITWSIKTRAEYVFNHKGWYMISLPVVPDTYTVTDLFPSRLRSQAYEWDPVQKTYRTVTSLHPGHGYWVALDDPASLAIVGEPLDFLNLTLEQGWNLIGAPFDIGAMQTIPADAELHSLLELNQATLTYQGAQSIRASQAYWIYAHAACELILYSTDAGTPLSLNTFLSNRNADAPPPSPAKITSIDSGPSAPGTFQVRQNYPNPFNPCTVLSYSLDRDGRVDISVYDLQGKRLKILYHGYQPAGNHKISWNGYDAENKSVPSGLYLIRVKTRGQTKTIKAMRIK